MLMPLLEAESGTGMLISKRARMKMFRDCTFLERREGGKMGKTKGMGAMSP
jgi:hypothetical protein